jgi:hypothetical protein
MNDEEIREWNKQILKELEEIDYEVDNIRKVKWEKIIINGIIVGVKVNKEDWLRLLEEDDTKNNKTGG